jgi:Domain of unknown function (DUF4124)
VTQGRERGNGATEQAEAMAGMRIRARQAGGPCARKARRPWPLGAAIAAASLVAALGFAGGVHGATYKWVDEKGVIHYTDKMPPEAVNKGSTMLDKQARPVKRIDPALTPEQQRARDAEEEQKRSAAKAQEEIARRDRALVASYSSEAEIDLARSRALATIDAQLESSRAYVAGLDKRKVELDRRREALGGKPVPAALERELEGNRSELAKTTQLIEQKQKERAATLARYDADRARWRELKAAMEANAPVAPAQASAAPVRTAPAATGAGGRM